MLAGAASPLFPEGSSFSAYCHARQVRLPGGADPDRLRASVAFLAGRFARQEGHGPRLWCDDVPHPSTAPAAVRRLDTEVHRPLEPGTQPFRAVLLRYRDQIADLVLVAHRSQLDAHSLTLLAEVLTGGRDGSGLDPALPSWTVDPDGDVHKARLSADYGDRIAWGPPCHMDAAQQAPGDAVTAGVALHDEGDATHAMLLVAAGIVLGRYEGHDRPVVAAVATDPGRPAHALGPFEFGTLFPADLSGARTLAQLLAESRRLLGETSLRCDAEQYRSLSSQAGGRVTVGVLSESPHGYLACQSAPFPLTLVPRRDAEGTLRLETHHQPEELSAAAARRFAVHVARVYHWMSGQPDDVPPADADPLDSAERAAIAALGHASAELQWRPDRIDSVIAERAAGTPEAIAVVCGDEQLTYTRLRTLAAQLAAGLRTQGVTPGDHVGVCLERSTGLVVALLAVLMADAVYVPMDPAYPAARLSYIAQDAELDVIVTDRTELADVPSRLVAPDDLIAAGTQAGPVPAPERGPDSAAYIIYTSGSTGRPKGVLIPHRNVIALLSATQSDFALGPADVWTFFHSSSFDFSVWEIWGALLTGARLVVVPYWVSRSTDEFHRLLVDEQVTVLSQTPSAFAQLSQADGEQEARLSVRLVVFGGEPLDTGTLRGWLDRYPESRCRLVNMFGITETTVHVTAQTISRGEALAGSRSVGRALPGWHLYVLDPRGRMLPTGASGEIHVGGEGVALAYWNRPELTDERFVKDPFSGGRMYRSGDRGRLLPDGRLEHLGRIDSQVKLRGFRIELDEIKNVLLDDPSVTAAAVVLGGDGAHDAAEARIDAYVVLASEDTTAVRRRAARILPEFMVPSTVTSLDSLPLTMNGKLDTRRLPPPALPTTTASQPCGDDSDLLVRLTSAWQDILGVPVGPDDNFFEVLGGNSLYAVRLAAEIRRRSIPSMSLRDLYVHPTVRALTAVLEQKATQN